MKVQATENPFLNGAPRGSRLGAEFWRGAKETALRRVWEHPMFGRWFVGCISACGPKPLLDRTAAGGAAGAGSAQRSIQEVILLCVSV